MSNAHRRFLVLALPAVVGAGVLGAQSSPPIPVWIIAPTPSIRIGDDQEPSKQFAGVIAAARLSNGELVVEERDTKELRVFSASGAFMKSLSRKGQGPGEFESGGPILRAGDTLFVAENRQVHGFLLNAGFIGRILVQAANVSTGILPIGRLSDGKYLVREGGFFRVMDPSTRAGELARGTEKLGILTTVGSGSVQWIGTFPGITTFAFASSALGNRVQLVVVPLAPALVRATSGSRIWIGDSGTGQITILDSNGSRVSQIAFPFPARRITDAMAKRARTAALETVTTPGRREMVAASYAREALPATLPFFSSFLPGVDGEMWVQETADDADAPLRLVVFDAGGKAIGRLVLPSRVTPREFGRDYLLGVETDTDGTERVVQYAVQRR